MGAGQSNDTTADEVITKTSYYELIGVSRQATEEEIKKAYRRKALELHPDRNFGNEEEATKTFAEVQAAYEILSDPQERAWYDSHEAAILRGDDGLDQDVHTYDNIRVTSADDLARVLRKFNSHVDFSDSPSGFYGFLREQFEHLAKEEEAAAAWDDVVAPDYPSFGHKDDRHDDVVKTFYSAWANFSTVKSFSWKDKYRLSEAPDRRIRRLMEKENNNIRQEAVREFNEAVRAFVLFVRKRDPRYTPSTQSETERQQVLRDAAAAQAARARAANQAKLEDEIPEWATYRDPDEIEESSEEEIVEEIFECVACDKTFKSERQFEAHERSKKHQKAIQALQRKMRKENANYDLDIAEADQPVLHDEDGYEVQDAVDDQYEAEMVAINSREDEIVKPEEAEQDATVNRQADEDDVDAQSPTEDDSSSDIDAANRLKNIHLDASDDPTDDSTTKPRKIGKAAQKRAKKAAASMNASSGENQHKCAGCDATFSSRTRLFQHIKDHGHAAPKQLTSAKAKKGKR